MITAARLDKIPFLVHGFGDRALSAAGIRRAVPGIPLRPVALRQVHSDTVHFVAGSRGSASGATPWRPGHPGCS